MCVVDSHTAEDGERLDKVLVILRECMIVKFVYQLYNADNLARGVLDGHAEDGAMPEACALVNRRIEFRVLVCIGDVHRLKHY